MKILHHPITVALGYTTLCLLFLIEPLTSSTHFLIYHASADLTPLFISTSATFCLLWFTLSAILSLARKHRRLEQAVWAVLILSLPRVIFRDIILLSQWTVPPGVSLGTLALPFAAFASLYLFRRSVLRSVFPPAQEFVGTLLGFAALSGVVLLFQLTWCAWQARNLNPPFVANSAPVVPGTTVRQVRVIWILLDELSYQQVYEHRFPGLSLPEFDRLAAQSVVFTHVIPTETLTERVLPSLFTGLPADLLRVSADGQLRSLRDPASGVWQHFDQRQTIFQDARAVGYRTGIAGWYNPYCRILPDVLDRCFWMDHSLTDDPRLAPGWRAEISSAVREFGTPLFNLVHFRIPQTDLEEAAGKHIADLTEIEIAADELLSDSSIDFAFLHIPLPHPGGIYDRKRETLSAAAGSSYIDNLALADAYLGHVRALLDRQGQWNSSVVVVMGDHSWRTQSLWMIGPFWTPEDELASHGGQFDDRPGYIVKMPGQQNAIRVDTPFKAIETRALLDAVIHNQLKTGEEVKAWAERR
jgi:Sulfatase